LIVSPDSPLRRIPSLVSRRQALFIEGIRYSIDMAELAWERLCNTLLSVTQMDRSDPEDQSHTSAMLDAWSIVDSLNRLRRLLEYMPGVKGKRKSPSYRLFMEATDQVPALRNTMQHLDTAIQDVQDNFNWAVWGSLAWAVVRPESNEILTCIFMPGIPVGQRPAVNPGGRAFWHVPIDLITIERSGVSVCLSDAMRRVVVVAASIDKSLSEAFAREIPEADQRKTHAADLTIKLVMKVLPDRILPEGSQDPEIASLPEDDEEPSTE
jgi:hypothetical protein